jgi:sec-independent protein translocase protein TatB
VFDISFGELMVIGVVALVVIGPEKLPKVARTVGALVGRAQRYVNNVKADIHREVNLSELKQVQSDLTSAAEHFQQSMQKEITEAQQSVAQVATEAQHAVTAPSAPPVTPPAIPAATSAAAPPPSSDRAP